MEREPVRARPRDITSSFRGSLSILMLAGGVMWCLESKMKDEEVDCRKKEKGRLLVNESQKELLTLRTYCITRRELAIPSAADSDRGSVLRKHAFHIRGRLPLRTH